MANRNTLGAAPRTCSGVIYMEYIAYVSTTILIAIYHALVKLPFRHFFINKLLLTVAENLAAQHDSYS